MTDEAPDLQRRLAPYVPRVVAEWLAEAPELKYRQVVGTCVHADISGFTALTERLARQGKLGAEETGDLLNQVFDPLLAAAYEYGAHLLKLAGDGALLFFDGENQTARAARASWTMLAKMRSAGSLRIGSESIRLGMSIGIHTGEFDFMLLGPVHRELIVTGPAATMTAAVEKLAATGTALLSRAAAAALPARCLGEPVGDAVQLIAAPKIAPINDQITRDLSADLRLAVAPQLREHLAVGEGDYEHRVATIAFIEFSGVDQLIAEQGYAAAIDAIEYVVDLVQRSATDTDVTLLSTDLNEDGAKMLLVAGAPRSHGDDEARMLSAVRRVVRPGGRLSLRAGVTRGRVFAGDYGPPHRRTYSVIGDSVNLAARVMAAAAPGQILALPDVVERSRTVFATTPVPPFRVKGKAEPVEALDIGDVLPRTVNPDRPAGALLGRNREIELLRDLLAKASSGRGQIVDLVGPAGIGKSTLVSALAADAADLGVRVLWTDGDPYERLTAYQALHGLLRRTMGFPESAAPETIADVLLEVARGTAPHLLPWMSLVGTAAGATIAPSPEVLQLDPTVRKSRLEAVTSELMGRALSMPTLVIVNDAHDIDSATLDLIRQLCLDVSDRSWLIVVTRRVDSTELGSFDRLTTLELAPLDVAAAGELLMKAAGAAPIRDKLLAELTDRAGGNPLFLEALAASVTAGQDLEELPESIEGMLAARIDRLPPHQRRLVRSAAVLGDSVEAELLAELVGPQALTADALAELSEFIVDEGDGRLRFAHGLVRLAAYEGLPFRLRTDLHARAAQAIDRANAGRADDLASVLSLHYLLGEMFEPAWRHGRRAAALARQNSALEQAAECYRRALVAARHLSHLSDAEVADAWAELAEIHEDLGELAEAEQALRQARRRVRTDPIRLARLQLATARHREAGGLYSEALSWVTRARRLLAGHTGMRAQRLRAELADRYAQIRYRQGQIGQAVEWAHRAKDEARASGDDMVAARADEILVLATAATGGEWDPAGFREAIALYEARGELAAKARAHNRLGAALYHAASWNDAAAQFEAAEADYRSIGREPDAITNAVNRADIRIDQGHHEEAASILEVVMPSWFATDSVSFLALGYLMLGRIELARGKPRNARSHFEQSAELNDSLEIPGDDLHVAAWAAECTRRLGDPGAALSETAELLAAFGDFDAPLRSLLERTRGLALAELGDQTGGLAAIEAALANALQWRSHRRVVDALDGLLAIAEQYRFPEPDRIAEKLNSWRAERAEIADRLGLIAPATSGA